MNLLNFRLTASALAALVLSGCVGSTQPVQVVAPEPELVPTNMGGYINEVSQAMADQLIRNTDITQFSDNPVAITSFVNLENFDETSRLSEIIVENMMHELQVRGHKVIDFKMMPYIRVTPDGDFVRSRDVDELMAKHNINIVLSGTYVYHNDGLVVNARMMEFDTGVVVSSAQGSVPGWYVDAVEGVKRATASVAPETGKPAADVEAGAGMNHALSEIEESVEPREPAGFSKELHALDDLLFSSDAAAAAEEAERQAAKEERYLCSPEGICFDRQRGKESVEEAVELPAAVTDTQV